MIENIDKDITLFINSLHCNILDFLMFHITHLYCAVAVYICAVAAIITIKKKRCWSDILFLTVAFAAVMIVIAAIIKPCVARLRPCSMEEIQHLLHTVKGYKAQSFSFLSSHAATSFLLAAFIHLSLRKKYLSVLFFSWAVIYSYSRIYLGVHFFGDVLCGALLGIACGFFTYKIQNCFIRKRY